MWALGIEIPYAPKSVGAYAPVFVDGSDLWVSGHTGRSASRPATAGVVGVDISIAQAKEHARLAGLNILAAAVEACDADRLKAVKFLRGYVRASPEFTQHPEVINAASDLFSKVFPASPAHARAAIGVPSLPGGATVELEAVLKLY